jgi:hypothetical protein
MAAAESSFSWGGGSKSSGRTRQGSAFNPEMIYQLGRTLGMPVTMPEIMSFFSKPARRSIMFPGASAGGIGFTPSGQGGPAGAGPGGAPGGAGAPPAPTAPPMGGGTEAPMGGGGAGPGGGAPPGMGPGRGEMPDPRQTTYSVADIAGTWQKYPDKQGDLPRLLKQADIDPNNFTYDEFARAVGKAKKYGFSGTSKGIMEQALAGLGSAGSLRGSLEQGRPLAGGTWSPLGF